MQRRVGSKWRHTGQKLTYVLFRVLFRGRAGAEIGGEIAHADEARRVSVNIAKLRELLQRNPQPG